jgi:hypothetical protein
MFHVKHRAPKWIPENVIYPETLVMNVFTI